jgi:peptide/nickel transport system substrate-binding protein
MRYLAMIVVLLLAACGSNGQSSGAASPTTDAATSAASATSDASTAAVDTPAPAVDAAPTAATTGEAKRLRAGLQFAPRAGWAIETNDAFVLTNLGVAETLVKVDFAGALAPSLAESWRAVDPTTWEFILREGVAFHNGEPLTVEAAAAALTSLLASATPPRGLSADSFTVSASDARTLRFTTSEPDALLPERLVSPNTAILAPAAYVTGQPTNPFGTGTGPFVLVEEVPEQSVSLQKNPTYWGGAVLLDEVEVLWVPDATIRAGMLQSAELDIAQGIPIPQVPVLSANTDLVVEPYDLPRTTALYLNHSAEPLSDVRVRQALAHAIDKQTLIDTILEGYGTVANGPFVPTQPWANAELTTYNYDPERARALLDEAGYGAGQLTLRLWSYSDRPELPLLLEAVQAMLEDAGIVVEPRVAEYETVYADVEQGNFDLFLLSRSHLTDAYDPDGFLSSDFGCEGSFNLNRFCDPPFDAALAPARSTTDIAARYALYQAAQAQIAADAVYVPLLHERRLNGHRQAVIGYQTHVLDHYTLTPELDLQP